MTDCNKKCWCKHIPLKSTYSAAEEFQHLIDRVDNVENYMRIDDRITASDVLGRLKVLEDLLEKMNEQINSFEEAVNDDNAYADGQVQERLSKIERCLGPLLANGNIISVEKKSPSKVPHKCPVCEDGIRLHPGSGGLGLSYCKTCEGKGIVWG